MLSILQTVLNICYQLCTKFKLKIVLKHLLSSFYVISFTFHLGLYISMYFLDQSSSYCFLFDSFKNFWYTNTTTLLTSTYRETTITEGFQLYFFRYAVVFVCCVQNTARPMHADPHIPHVVMTEDHRPPCWFCGVFGKFRKSYSFAARPCILLIPNLMP